MDQSEKCTILVCSSDGYEDTWKPFFKLMAYYWKDCPYPIVLNTETKEYSDDKLDVHCLKLFQSQNIPYGKRMIEHLKRIKTPYTLILMDDFFIRKKVNDNAVAQVIEWMDNDSRAVMFNLLPLKDEKNIISHKYKGYEKRPIVGPYKYNFQASVWRTDYLIKSWKAFETPWEWELVGNYRSFTSKYDFYTISRNTDLPIDYGYKDEGMGIYRGKWVIDSVDELFKEHGIDIDYSKRGIYCDTDKNLVRMRKKTKINDEYRFARSVGITEYVKYIAWVLKRKFISEKNLEKTYYEYRRKNSKNVR